MKHIPQWLKLCIKYCGWCTFIVSSSYTYIYCYTCVTIWNNLVLGEANDKRLIVQSIINIWTEIRLVTNRQQLQVIEKTYVYKHIQNFQVSNFDLSGDFFGVHELQSTKSSKSDRNSQLGFFTKNIMLRVLNFKYSRSPIINYL